MSPVNKDVLLRVSKIAFEAIKSESTKSMLVSEGYSKNDITLANMFLSMMSGGRDNIIRSFVSSIAASALNDYDVQKELLASEEIDNNESSIAAIIFMRLRNKQWDCIPKSIEDYLVAVNALKENDYKNTVYARLT